MGEQFLMSNGKMVDFYSTLTHDGIMVEVEQTLTAEEKFMFKKELREERDVVSISFNKDEEKRNTFGPHLNEDCDEEKCTCGKFKS